MTRRTYPRLSQSAKIKAGSICDACDYPATWKVTIQNSWVPAENDYLKLCHGHRTQAFLGNWDQLYRDINSRRPTTRPRKMLPR